MAKLIELYGRVDAHALLAGGKAAAFGRAKDVGLAGPPTPGPNH